MFDLKDIDRSQLDPERLFMVEKRWQWSGIAAIANIITANISDLGLLKLVFCALKLTGAFSENKKPRRTLRSS
jgi:hypothetical protein